MKYFEHIDGDIGNHEVSNLRIATMPENLPVRRAKGMDPDKAREKAWDAVRKSILIRPQLHITLEHIHIGNETFNRLTGVPDEYDENEAIREVQGYAEAE